MRDGKLWINTDSITKLDNGFRISAMCEVVFATLEILLFSDVWVGATGKSKNRENGQNCTPPQAR